MNEFSIEADGISNWRFAAMLYVGAAARAADRDERARLLRCASECLDRADALLGLPPPEWRPAVLH